MGWDITEKDIEVTLTEWEERVKRDVERMERFYRSRGVRKEKNELEKRFYAAMKRLDRMQGQHVGAEELYRFWKGSSNPNIKSRKDVVENQNTVGGEFWKIRTR